MEISNHNALLPKVENLASLRLGPCTSLMGTMLDMRPTKAADDRLTTSLYASAGGPEQHGAQRALVYSETLSSRARCAKRRCFR